MEIDPFEGLGRALAELRARAGFKWQKEAAEKLGFDRGQVSRWESDNLRPSLENLTRLLNGYGATLMDLAVLVCGEEISKPAAESKAEDRGPTKEEEMIRSLSEAVRRAEGRQKAIDFRLLRLEEKLG
jgi:transcriptional regulator with XRE-family HTH domain